MYDADGEGLARLARALARHDRLADWLPELHQQTLRVSGGRSSVLLRFDPRRGGLHGVTAAGVHHLDAGPWLTAPDEWAAAERAWADGAPVIFTQLSGLTARLESTAAMLVPLRSRDERLGLLAVGLDDVSGALRASARVSAVGDLLSVALQRARLQRETELQRELRELVADLTRSVSASLPIDASLEHFCHLACRLFAASRVAVWLHNRRARRLYLAASSDAAELAAAMVVATDDARVPVSRVMRLPQAELAADEETGLPDVLVPLRGRRRALGTLVVAGIRTEPGDEVDLLTRIEEVGRRLSNAIENVWLFEDVVRSRRELYSTFNALADLVVVSNRQGRITLANAAFSARARPRTSEPIGRPLAEFFGAALMAWIAQVEQQVPRPMEYESREIRDDVLGGTFLFTMTPLLGPSDERLGTVIVARDVSEQTRLAAEREELNDRLAQSEKLAALGQFVAGIAHELNNPLQGVLGHVELLLQHTAPVPPAARRELRLVFREAERAAKIVQNLLVFAGSRRITRRRLNANHVVTRALALRARSCAAATIEVVTNLAEALPRVAGDALLLQQALLNIIVNAEQALAGASGPRRLELRTRAATRRLVQIVIEDSGPGISPDALPRLFEPFFTTKEVGQGTGLGLAIAYGIVQEHDGRLLAANRPGGGAVFTVELPAG